ncbi:M48 family metalloprotease [Halobacteriovorax sp. HLS]|uniref:M48 family metalloprotease n=1 Tax=Halobacteriovorax sp. HLS TaxID=2234000 RepID=UPI000FDC74B6|nr:M48 family metalloprotease [Halobacteriovorax sp. HLS]
MLNKEKFKFYLENLYRQKLLYLLALALIMGFLGLIFFKNFIFALIFIGAPIIISTVIKLSKTVALSSFGAVELEQYKYPQVYEIIRELSYLSHLDHVPELYLIPGEVPNALAVGEDDSAGIGISEGLLRTLSHAELRGVLAHEVSHIRNRDHKVLKVIHIAYSMSSFISFSVNIILILSLPLILTGRVQFSGILILFVLLCPNLIQLLALAFMRNTELKADLCAVELTEEPEALASALLKINKFQKSRMKQFFIHKTHHRDHWLDTHPSPIRRIKRLNKLAAPN